MPVPSSFWIYTSLAALFVLGTVMQVVRVFASEQAQLSGFHSWLIDSDLCWPEMLYRDLLQDGYSLRTFQFSAVTFWFPDVSLYFGLRAIVGQASTTIVLWSLSLFLLVVLAAMGMLRAFASEPAKPHVRMIVLQLAAIYLGYNALSAFQNCSQSHLLRPLYRPGTVICVFVALAMSGNALHRERRYSRLVGLAAFTALADFSDRLFAVWFTAPFVTTLVIGRLCRVVNGLSWRPSAGLAAAACLGTLVGHLAIKVFPTDTVDPLATYYNGLHFQGWFERLELLWLDIVSQIATGNLLLLAAFLWYPLCAIVAIRSLVPGALGRSSQRSLLGLFCLFSLLSASAAIAIFLLTRTSTEVLGHLPWDAYARYFQSLTAFAVFGWALLAAEGMGNARIGVRVAIAMLPWLGLAAINLPLASVGLTPGCNPWDVYPDFVADIDRVCAERGLRHGLGGYWIAKRVTAFSKAGVVVNQVANNPHTEFGFQAHNWLNNGAHFWHGPTKAPESNRPEFLVVSKAEGAHPDLHLETILSRLGEPAERVPIRENLEILVYNRLQDERFRNFASYDTEVLNLRFRAARPHSIRYPAASLPTPMPGVGVSNFPSRTAMAGLTPAGLLTFGPHLIPPPGWYRATVRATSHSPGLPNVFQIVATIPGDPNPIRLATAELPDGEALDTTLDFKVSPKLLATGARIEFYTIDSGQGFLSLDWIDLVEQPRPR